ncbi:MAG: IS982 family transposase [Gammaproteobacteria bacterium]|nr:IS982 family transposase [Gammaproteobacteria bacterium]
MNITLSELFLILFVWIDDWHQGHFTMKRTAGRPALLSDSEMLTLMIVMDFIEFSSERHYVEFMKRHYRNLFPHLLDHSQYNRRSRALISELEELRWAFNSFIGIKQNYCIIDTTPIVAVGMTRDKSHSDFAGIASYGYCATKRLVYYGFKLVMLCNLEGLPLHIELVPANTDERAAADEILDKLSCGSIVIGDKGFIGKDWQNRWSHQGINILAFTRKNQHTQISHRLWRRLRGIRARIEGTYKLLKENGRSIEHTLAHTVEGLCTRVVAKITSLASKLFLRKEFGIDVLTFTQQIN